MKRKYLPFNRDQYFGFLILLILIATGIIIKYIFKDKDYRFFQDEIEEMISLDQTLPPQNQYIEQNLIQQGENSYQQNQMNIHGNRQASENSDASNDNLPNDGEASTVFQQEVAASPSLINIYLKGGVKEEKIYHIQENTTLADLLTSNILMPGVNSDCDLICKDLILKDGMILYIPKILCSNSDN